MMNCHCKWIAITLTLLSLTACITSPESSSQRTPSSTICGAVIPDSLTECPQVAQVCLSNEETQKNFMNSAAAILETLLNSKHYASSCAILGSFKQELLNRGISDNQIAVRMTSLKNRYLRRRTESTPPDKLLKKIILGN